MFSIKKTTEKHQNLKVRIQTNSSEALRKENKKRTDGGGDSGPFVSSGLSLALTSTQHKNVRSIIGCVKHLRVPRFCKVSDML